MACAHGTQPRMSHTAQVQAVWGLIQVWPEPNQTNNSSLGLCDGNAMRFKLSSTADHAVGPHCQQTAPYPRTCPQDQAQQ
eukprot:2587093-Amphidinium_carterae.1